MSKQNIHDEEQRISDSIKAKLSYILGTTQYKVDHHWDFEEISNYVATLEYTLREMKMQNDYMLGRFKEQGKK